MQFQDFDWLSGHGIWALYHAREIATIKLSSASSYKRNQQDQAIFHNYSTRACWIWDDYSQLGATRLFGYLSSHIQRALVE